MRVPAPGGDGEAVVFVPLQVCRIVFVDHGHAAALDGVIHGGAGVAVQARLLSGLEHL